MLPAKQANIVFEPFAHSIITVTTIVEGNRLIASSITHRCRRRRRLYHKFRIRIYAQMNIYLICHLWLRVCSMSWSEIDLFNNDEKYLRRMCVCVCKLILTPIDDWRSVYAHKRWEIDRRMNDWDKTCAIIRINVYMKYEWVRLVIILDIIEEMYKLPGEYRQLCSLVRFWYWDRHLSRRTQIVCPK